jgi:hypothetical protein
MMGIDCRNVGNQSEIKTILHTGVMPEIMEQKITATEEYARCTEELDEIVAGMAKILRVRQQTGTLSDALQNHLDGLKQRKNDIFAQCAEIKKRLDELESVILKSREAKIRIDGYIYKGTLITIDDRQFAIENNTRYMEYTSQNGVIVGTVVM